MKTTLKALALGAAVATTGAVTASAMEMEFNMLTGAVYNALKQNGFDTTNIDNLTLADIAEIKFLLEGGDMGNPQRAKINQILSK